MLNDRNLILFSLHSIQVSFEDLHSIDEFRHVELHIGRLVIGLSSLNDPYFECGRNLV